MKQQLKDKISTQGSLADELVKTGGYQLISKKMSERKESLLKEALDSNTLKELGYAKGYIDGISFFQETVEAMIRQRETLKKKR